MLYQSMKINIHEKLEMSNIMLVASLPDMGRVGGLVSSLLAKQLKADLVAEIESIEKPWVLYEDGVATMHVDVYSIYADKQNSIIIFTGETQPQEGLEVYRLCYQLIDLVQSFGEIKRIYTAGGYLRSHVSHEPKVYGVVNNPELLPELERYAERIGGEINTITWFNGLILGVAAERKIDAIGLFAEIDNPNIPQNNAAKSILKVLSRMMNREIMDLSMEDNISKKNQNIAY